MRRHILATLTVLPFILAACSGSPESTTNETPAQTTQEPTHKGVLLVEKLPAEVEGVELADGGLKVMDGYEFVKDSKSTFAIARMSDRKVVTRGGCGCNTTGACDPVFKGGIIICEATNCSDCGLALMIGGVRTAIFKY